MWFEAFPVTFDVSSIYPFIYFVSSAVIFNVTPPSWSTAFATESKFTVTNSFMFKSKFLLSVLIASGASPYEYACVILSSPCPSIFTYVSWIYVKFLDTFFENFFIYMRPLSLLHYILNLYWYKWYTELLMSPFTPIQI